MFTLIRTVIFTAPLVAFVAPAAAAETAAMPPSPEPWLKAKVEEARQLSLRKVEAGSPEEQKLKDELHVLIDDMLDWDALTRKSLGRYWTKIKSKQQKAFSKLLRQLIEASYRSKMRLASKDDVDRPDKVEIKWDKPDIEKTSASIAAKVTADKSKTFLGFRLNWDGKRWHVWDVSIDDVSTVRTYRSQFRKLIKEEGFDELMKRMRAKLADIEAGRADIPVK